MPSSRRASRFSNLVSIALLTVFAAESRGDAGVSLTDIATDPASGLEYARVRSERDQLFDEIKAGGVLRFPEDVLRVPIKSRGVPGVVIFDHDRDGDLDLFVTNGPGRANSLFSSQLRESGELRFVDIAVEAGVDATAQDSSGVVAGDLDNDGDLDLFVLAAPGRRRLFENQGGVFTDVTAGSGTAGNDSSTAQSACLGDVNGDGLLDIFIVGAADFKSNIPIFEPFPELNQHNELLLNTGGNVFVDVSDAAGVTTQAGFPPGFENAPSLGHVCALVDYDLDGDVDIFTGDDQGAIPPTSLGGADNGLIHLWRNDGSGSFADVNVATGLNKIGGWMGITFADFNHDGAMDFFATNFGNYARQTFPVPVPPRAYDTRWFLGTADGSFLDPGIGDLVAIPFGWGTSAADYDNDGDTDVVFHGGLDLGPFVTADNPGVILSNDGHANFTYDAAALAGSTDHSRRTVQAMAVGDLNEDGFVDVVSVSNFDYPAPLPLIPFLPLGSVFDATAVFWPTFLPTADPFVLVFNDALPPLPDGSLSVEVSSGGNGNGAVTVDLLGTVGLTASGSVNRDGIGAVVSFTPRGGRTAMRPVAGGSSFASQDSLSVHFGSGQARRGTLEVLWPGGVRNRLDDVRPGERILFPEIPCSVTDESLPRSEYVACVLDALEELVEAGILTPAVRARFLSSALR